MAKLSIIIPFGTSIERPYIKERVIQKAQEYKSDELVEYIFVEGFSSEVHQELPSIITKYGHKYFKDESQQKMGAYSLGQCRNLGVVYATASVVMSLDVDYYLSRQNLEKILKIIEIKGINRNPNTFLVLPCVFLSEKGSEFLLTQPKELWDTLVVFDVQNGINRLTKFYSPASSSIVMNRHKYLEIGGNDSSFIGHGYEDFDLMMRIFKSCAVFEKMPTNLDFDFRNWTFDSFKGFRAWFSIVGNEMANFGVYMYHFWHIEPNQNNYLDNREFNHQKFYKNLKAFKNIYDGPDCLQDKKALGKRILAFTPENGSVYRSLRGISIYLGEIVCKREYEFFSGDEFLAEKFMSFLAKFRISYVLFPNPYGNTMRLNIYEFVRKIGINYICWDRGALPDSWFFDTNGFNYDSSSYDEKYWNKPLSIEDKEATEKYIKELLTGKNTLETQGDSLEILELKRKFGIRYKRVVFVPLQMHSDTVVKYFTYEPFNFNGFLEIINKIAGELANDDVVFLTKKHPLMLELDKEKYPNLTFVADNTNFLDLLKLCDMAVMINSGIGVYAMMAEKPCVLCGNAFYHFNGINLQANGELELKKYILEILENGFSFDKDKMLKFIRYLENEFYSYGSSIKELVKDKENNKTFHKTKGIDFYKIRFCGEKILECESIEKFTYKLNSFAYKPYLYEIKNILPKISNNTKSTSISQAKNRLYSAVSHTKFYRLFRKLFTRPKDFIMDSKKPLMQPIKLLVR